MEYDKKAPLFDKKNQKFDITGTLTSPVNEKKEKEKSNLVGDRENIFQHENGVINKLNEKSKEKKNNSEKREYEEHPEKQVSS
jgi:hypothetical protein